MIQNGLKVCPRISSVVKSFEIFAQRNFFHVMQILLLHRLRSNRALYHIHLKNKFYLKKIREKKIKKITF